MTTRPGAEHVAKWAVLTGRHQASLAEVHEFEREHFGAVITAADAPVAGDDATAEDVGPAETAPTPPATASTVQEDRAHEMWRRHGEELSAEHDRLVERAAAILGETWATTR
ncbi:MAG: hypothetical protein R2698_00480 [Microthrixaceae bacterium]